jgi:hypothetical protein
MLCIRTGLRSGWKPPHLCGGRSPSALREVFPFRLCALALVAAKKRDPFMVRGSHVSGHGFRRSHRLNKDLGFVHIGGQRPPLTHSSLQHSNTPVRDGPEFRKGGPSSASAQQMPVGAFTDISYITNPRTTGE